MNDGYTTMSSTNGYVMPQNGTILWMTVTASNNNNGSISLRVNGNDVGAIVYFSGGNAATATWYNYKFNAGDVLSFYVAGASTYASNPIATAGIRFRLN